MKIFFSLFTLAAAYLMTSSRSGVFEYLLLLLCGGGIVLLLTNKEERKNSISVFVLLMNCYFLYAAFCHWFRLSNGFEFIGSLDGGDYYVVWTDDLLRFKNLSDVISVQNPGIGFQRLRKKEDIKIAKVGMLELGMSNSDLVIGDGFLQTKENEWFNFIGVQKELRFKNIKLFQKAKISFGTPKTIENSMISNFSNIYTASVDFGATIGDWSFGISIPDTVIDGTMGLRLPIGRADNGSILYKDYEINMRSHPAIEYSISYKSITASFVDNPYGTDEFFILTRGKISF